ncbi:putative translation initiation factor eIF-2B delta subunit [Naematelia encephala]|uniref:Translation initiation factor eIF2B subunit delta n=1 Tax=Naematelia encephala TaxID=71784 RepID=A0A1Y2BCB6_9TREE|nr:putative translation initiation factor eIF-2B delta subunit [Naematelia encephala]
MSTPEASTSTPRPPKPAKQAKPPSQSSSTGTGDAPKAKSAKELKKEKRAAAVASRGPVDDPSDPRSSTGPESATTNKNRPSGNSTTPASASHPTLSLPNSSQSRRPPILTSTSEYTVNTPQNLFFSHLPTHRPPQTPAALVSAKLPPLIVRLGVLMSSGTLRGANARTMATMAAFAEVVREYTCPDQAVLWKDLPVYLSPMIAFLEDCRPKGVGGGNAIRWLKGEINRLGELGDRTDAEQKEYLVEAIGVYIRDRIEYADKVIADNAKEKIKPGNTVVTYARSSVVERVILEAWRDMRSKDPSASFSVIVVDSRPLNEGKHLLSALKSAGVPCTYTLLPLLSAVLPGTNLVLLGASALHSDGALYSRAGTAVVAMLAKECRVPVMACVETYKFGERVVLDAVASNELGDAEALLDIPVKGLGLGKGGKDGVLPLSLTYDLTPPALITVVCTEIGFIPPSSVPTVLGKASGVA